MASGAEVLHQVANHHDAATLSSRMPAGRPFDQLNPSTRTATLPAGDRPSSSTADRTFGRPSILSVFFASGNDASSCHAGPSSADRNCPLPTPRTIPMVPYGAYSD